MARQKSTDLVGFIFGAAKKAAGRRPTPSRPKPMFLQGAGMDLSTIPDALQTGADVLADTFSNQIRIFKNFSIDGTLSEFFNPEIFAIADPHTPGKIWRFDPKGNNLFDPITRQTYEDYMATTPPAGVNVSQAIQSMNVERQRRADRVSRGDITLASMVKSHGFVRNAMTTAFPSLKGIYEIGDIAKMGKEDPMGAMTAFGRRMLPNVLGSGMYRGLLKNSVEQKLGRVLTGDEIKLLNNNYDNLVKPAIDLSHIRGDWLKQREDAQKRGFALEFDARGNIVKTTRLSDARSLVGVEGVMAQEISNLIDKKVTPYFGDLGIMLGYFKSGKKVLDSMFDPDPKKAYFNILRNFAFSNKGFYDLANNQMLMSLAKRYPNSNWAWMQKKLNWAANEHWITKHLQKWVNDVFMAKAKDFYKWLLTFASKGLAKLGFKGIAHALGQAAGSSIPGLGNLVMYILVEILFKVIEYVMKIIVELFRIISWVLFTLLAGLVVMMMLVYFILLSPEAAIPGQGMERPGIGGATDNLYTIDGTVYQNIPSSDGTCPSDHMSRCTNGYSEGQHTPEHAGWLAMDFSISAGSPVYSPCDGTARFGNYDKTCKAAGRYAYVTCSSTGMVFVLLHIVPIGPVGSTISVTAGQAVGTITSETDPKCSTGAHLHIDCRINGAYARTDQCLESVGCTAFQAERNCVFP